LITTSIGALPRRLRTRGGIALAVHQPTHAFLVVAGTTRSPTKSS
jgi:hypothetical protein